jgi:hypothetical protein
MVVRGWLVWPALSVITSPRLVRLSPCFHYDAKSTPSTRLASAMLPVINHLSGLNIYPSFYSKILVPGATFCVRMAR